MQMIIYFTIIRGGIKGMSDGALAGPTLNSHAVVTMVVPNVSLSCIQKVAGAEEYKTLAKKSQ